MGIYLDMPLDLTSLSITPEFLKIIAELDEFRGSWIALGRLAPERLTALRKVATIESVGSSTRIEGSKLSDAQVEGLLGRIDVARFETRDEQEVAGYADVMETVFLHARNIDLSINYILQLHRDLLKHSDKDERHRGRFKTMPNHVSAFDPEGNEVGVVFETATPFDTPRLMEELIEWTNEELESGYYHPLLVTGIFTVAFLEIHPFQDGNGRLSRILTVLLLLRSGYTYVPYASIESVIEVAKERYYIALRQTQRTIRSPRPDWQPFLQFFLETLLSHKQNLAAKLEGEHRLLKALPPLALQILDLAKAHGRLSNAQVVTLTGANRNTVKKHLAALVDAGQLVREGQGKGTRYGLG